MCRSFYITNRLSQKLLYELLSIECLGLLFRASSMLNSSRRQEKMIYVIYVVVQFCPWFKFYYLLFLGMVMYDNEFEIKEN